MTTIHEFLASPEKDYNTGLEIYHKVKKDASKDQFFNAGKNSQRGSLHHNLLMEALRNAARIMAASPLVKQPSKPPKTITAKPLKASKPRFAHNEIVNVKSLPKELQERYFENQQLTRELSGLHQQLRSARSDQTRKNLALQIKEYTKKRQENWKVLDAYAKSSKTTGGDKPKHPKLDQYIKELKSGKLTKKQIAYRERMIKKWRDE